MLPLSIYTRPFYCFDELWNFLYDEPIAQKEPVMLFQDEATKEYYYEFDLPGMKKEDVKISTDDKQLYISAERKNTKRQIKFEKTIILSKKLDISTCRATLEAGVLKLLFKSKEAVEAPKRKEILIP